MLHTNFATLADLNKYCRSVNVYNPSFHRPTMYLKAVLVVGNVLNGSSFRGGARGFQLEALLKVGRTAL
jgi:hypothetical protein